MLFPLAFFWLSILTSGTHLDSLSPIYTAHADEIRPLWDATTTQDAIESLSEEYHISSSTMARIVSCETGGNTGSTTIQSLAVNSKGQQENSWGLVQIDLDYHPDISRDEAQNPIFALTFLAQNLAAGNGHLWTCFNMMK